MPDASRIASPCLDQSAGSPVQLLSPCALVSRPIHLVAPGGRCEQYAAVQFANNVASHETIIYQNLCYFILYFKHFSLKCETISETISETIYAIISIHKLKGESSPVADKLLNYDFSLVSPDALMRLAPSGRRIDLARWRYRLSRQSALVADSAHPARP